MTARLKTLCATRGGNTPRAGDCGSSHATRWPGIVACVFVACAGFAGANPIERVGETFSQWKDRLFGKGHPAPEAIRAPASGVVALVPGQPVRLRISEDTPQRELAKGKSRYREIELPTTFAHAVLRVQVVAQRGKERGNTVFKPIIYVQGEGSQLAAPIEVKPLHLDIRPFRKTRLLGCVKLADVHRFMIATDAGAIGKSYVSEVREAIKAPTANGFYYSTDAIKAHLPWAATGTLILEISAAREGQSEC